ncbi:MAG: hypothetical protein JWQ75_2016 [Pseudarthrobacter sp.]|nr:hypothetical protein [Pseudarthrobacter sp.]
MSNETPYNKLGSVGSAVFSRSSFLKGAAALATVAAASSFVGRPAPANAATTRSALRQPFSSDSFWNTSVGSGAKFESALSTRTASFLSGSSYINCEEWSIPVVNAGSADPVASVRTSPTWAWNYRVPTNAQIALGTDGHSVITQPDAATAYENWIMRKVSNTSWTSGYQVKTDLRGKGGSDGVRAAGVSGLGGLIRAHEIAELNIPHALAMAIPRSKLKLGQVWPANRQDDDASSSYKGTIPMGTMLAIPASVNVASLGLTPEGLALARALQDYGAYVVDAAGGNVLYAEPAAAGPAFERLRNDFTKVRKQMRIVTNSTSSTVAGGGTRRRPPAAPLS